jgi:hypothetical protein
MHRRLQFAIILIAATHFCTWATAQNVYKCGDAYSQQACPGGVAVNADDPRTSEQKSQADLATQRDARTANAMEKARLQQEAKDIAANTPKPLASAKQVKKTPAVSKKASSVRSRAPAVKKTRVQPKKTKPNQPADKS